MCRCRSGPLETTSIVKQLQFSEEPSLKSKLESNRGKDQLVLWPLCAFAWKRYTHWHIYCATHTYNKEVNKKNENSTQIQSVPQEKMEAHQGTARWTFHMLWCIYGVAKQANCAASQCTSCKTIRFFKRELLYIFSSIFNVKTKI